MNIAITNMHLPQAGSPDEIKERRYKELDDIVKERKVKGLIIVSGDFNVKLDKADRIEKGEIVGNTRLGNLFRQEKG